MPDPQARKPDVELKTLTPVRIIFQFVIHPVGMQFDLIVIVTHTLLLWLLLCLWVRGIFFGRFQDFFFVGGCSGVSCDIGVFVRRNELTSFFAILLASWGSI